MDWLSRKNNIESISDINLARGVSISPDGKIVAVPFYVENSDNFVKFRFYKRDGLNNWKIVNFSGINSNDSNIKKDFGKVFFPNKNFTKKVMGNDYDGEELAIISTSNQITITDLQTVVKVLPKTSNEKGIHMISASIDGKELFVKKSDATDTKITVFIASMIRNRDPGLYKIIVGNGANFFPLKDNYLTSYPLSSGNQVLILSNISNSNFWSENIGQKTVNFYYQTMAVSDNNLLICGNSFVLINGKRAFQIRDLSKRIVKATIILEDNSLVDNSYLVTISPNGDVVSLTNPKYALNKMRTWIYQIGENGVYKMVGKTPIDTHSTNTENKFLTVSLIINNSDETADYTNKFELFITTLDQNTKEIVKYYKLEYPVSEYGNWSRVYKNNLVKGSNISDRLGYEMKMTQDAKIIMASKFKNEQNTGQVVLYDYNGKDLKEAIFNFSGDSISESLGGRIDIDNQGKTIAMANNKNEIFAYIYNSKIASIRPANIFEQRLNRINLPPGSRYTYELNNSEFFVQYDDKTSDKLTGNLRVTGNSFINYGTTTNSVDDGDFLSNLWGTVKRFIQTSDNKEGSVFTLSNVRGTFTETTTGKVYNIAGNIRVRGHSYADRFVDTSDPEDNYITGVIEFNLYSENRDETTYNWLPAPGYKNNSRINSSWERGTPNFILAQNNNMYVCPVGRNTDDVVYLRYYPFQNYQSDPLMVKDIGKITL